MYITTATTILNVNILTLIVIHTKGFKEEKFGFVMCENLFLVLST